MKLAAQIKSKALRSQGYSVKEIAKLLNVSKGSVSIWVRNVPLSEKAKNRLLERIRVGQYVAAENKKRRTDEKERKYFKEAQGIINHASRSSSDAKILCALIYWCEGTKDVRNGVRFTNSDPRLVRRFLDLLRREFNIEEKRVSVRLHLHHYHDEGEQKKFWAHKLGIKQENFRKSYQKPRGGKRYRERYPGCILLQYPGTDFARRLQAIAKTYLGYKI